jgi:hypothetical protein
MLTTGIVLAIWQKANSLSPRGAEFVLLTFKGF